MSNLFQDDAGLPTGFGVFVWVIVFILVTFFTVWIDNYFQNLHEERMAALDYGCDLGQPEKEKAP